VGMAIVGTGRFAASRIVPALTRAQGCTLRAVISRSRERAAAFAEEHGIPRAYDDLAAALADPAVEGLWVATPHNLHREVVEAGAAARKHILCEKPLATTVEDATAMVTACRRAGVALGTGFHLRHHPLHQEVRRLIATGAAGHVLCADAEWSLETPVGAGAPWRTDIAVAGGGIMTGTVVHIIDLMRSVLDDEPVEVAAFTDADSSPVSPVETRAVVQMRFARGTLATVRGVRPARAPANDLVIEGTAAHIIGRGTIDEASRGRLDVTGADAELSGVPAGTDMYARQAEAFARAIYAGEEPNASGWDGLRAVEVTTAVYEAARMRRAVAIPPARRR